MSVPDDYWRLRPIVKPKESSMKPRKMQPRVMWAVVNKFRGLLAKGNMFDTREAARRDWRDMPDDLQNDCRVVRVRVTEAP